MTPRPFRFSVQTGPFRDPRALREFAKQVEALGYDELYTSDHIGNVDPFLPLIVAAEATTTLRFGPLTINNELHNTGLLARTAATFDLLSEGRLVLGLGTGYAVDEHAAINQQIRPPKARVDRFEQSVVALRALLDDGSHSTVASELELDIADLGVRPHQVHVPFLIGCTGRRMVGIAARHADIIQLTGLTHDPSTGVIGVGGFSRDAVQKRVRWIDEATPENRGPSSISALVQVTAVGGTNPTQTLADALEVPLELAAETPFALGGSEAQIIEELERNRTEFGIDHLVVRDPEGFAPIVAALAGL